MKETFIDPETGWTVARETVINPQSGALLIEETITDPQTGEEHHGSRLPSQPCSIAAWVRKIAEVKAMVAREEQKTKQNLHQMYPELAAGAQVPAGPLGKVKLGFAESFAAWNICLPEDDIANRRRGKMVKAGWAIWYLFGSNQRGEYLDYYASHRMTNDRHVRIYADGEFEELPAISEFHLVSQDSQENTRLAAEYYAKNRRVVEMLQAKGFGLQGNEPGSVQINRYLRSQKPQG